MDEQFHSGLVLTISGQSTQPSIVVVILKVTEAWTPLVVVGKDGKAFSSYNNNARETESAWTGSEIASAGKCLSFAPLMSFSSYPRPRV